MSDLGRYDEEIHGVDERIGRLAIALGVDVSQDTVLVSFIRNHLDAFCGNEPGRRALCEQLRALIMLKYRIEEGCMDYLGDGPCRALLDAERERLRRQGFKTPIGGGDPGDAG